MIRWKYEFKLFRERDHQLLMTSCKLKKSFNATQNNRDIKVEGLLLILVLYKSSRPKLPNPYKEAFTLLYS